MEMAVEQQSQQRAELESGGFGGDLASNVTQTRKAIPRRTPLPEYFDHPGGACNFRTYIAPLDI